MRKILLIGICIFLLVVGMASAKNLKYTENYIPDNMVIKEGDSGWFHHNKTFFNVTPFSYDEEDGYVELQIENKFSNKNDWDIIIGFDENTRIQVLYFNEIEKIEEDFLIEEGVTEKAIRKSIKQAFEKNNLKHSLENKEEWKEFKNAKLKKNDLLTFEFQLYTEFQPYTTITEKYDICIKPSDMTIEEADEAGMLICIDPWYNVTYYAIQEFANETAASGTWYYGGADNAPRVLDGLYGTHDSASTQNGVERYVYMNYTKPALALNTSKWRYSWSAYTNSLVNVTMSDNMDCWNYDANKLIFRLGSIGFASDDTYVRAYCYNGSWKMVGNNYQYLLGSTVGGHVREEAMLWNFDNTWPIVHDYNLIPPQPLVGDFLAYINITDNDGVGGGIDWCNFTFRMPNGTLILNNSPGYYQGGNIWYSDNITMQQITEFLGTWNVSVTCADNWTVPAINGANWSFEILSIGGAVVSGVTTYINHTPAQDGLYRWNISCTANGNPDPIYSANYQTLYDTTPPNVTNYVNESKPFFPEIDDDVHINVTVTDNYNTTHCKLQVNDNGSWFNASTYYVGNNNSVVQMLYTIRNVSQANNSLVYWTAWCNDSAGNVFNGLQQAYWVRQEDNNGSWFNGTWTNENNTIDGNWSSWGYLTSPGCGNVGYGQFYFNYTIPEGALRANFSFRRGGLSNSSYIVDDVDAGCIENNNGILIMRAAIQSGFTSLPQCNFYGYQRWQCWNGSTWQTIYNKAFSYPNVYSDAYIYEETTYWEYNDDIQTINVTDVTLPAISVGDGNSFSTNNRSVISNALHNLSLNITYFDYNLFQTFINISCDTSGEIYYWEELNWNQTSYTHIDEVDLTGLPMQRCVFLTGASDDHTDNTIGDYKVKKIDKGFEWETDRGIKIKIENLDTGSGDIDSMESTKKDDRYSFSFNYKDKKNKRTFIVESDKILYPIIDSNYPAHFVAWNPETKSGNWIDFAEYDVNGLVKKDKEIKIKQINDYRYEVEVKSDKDIDSLGFNSIGGTNVNNASYSFYIGGAVNVTGLNVYDNGSISNFSVVVTTNNSYPGYNGTQYINSTQGWVQNLSNGTYTFTFVHPHFYNQTYFINITNNSQDFQWSSYQGIVNIRARNVKTLVYLNELNITVTNEDSAQADVQNNVSVGVFYLNATSYNLTLEKTDYVTYSEIFNLSYLENKTIIVEMPFLATFRLWDERTHDPFNISSPDKISFLLFCPDETYTTEITAVNSSIPITCNYIKFKFVLDYGATSYYRTFILDPDEALDVDIYLIDLLTTQYIYNSLILDDLLSSYDNPSIYVNKIINDQTVQITADYVDVENKIGAYLIENHEYIIEVHSDNNPVRVLGFYSADISGEKVLKLYDITLQPTPSGVIKDISYVVDIVNTTGDDILTAVYDDKQNLTTAVTFTVVRDTYNGTVLYTSTVSGESQIQFEYNITPYENVTLFAEMQIQRPTGDFTYTKRIREVTQITLEIFQFVSQSWFNWFFTILLSVIAIYATIKTANQVTAALLGLAALFVIFGWYGVSWGVLGLCILVALLAILKEGSGGRKII